MENSQPRTIAYCLAKEIDNNDLSEITGGKLGGTVGMTLKRTDTPNSPDMEYDWDND